MVQAKAYIKYPQESIAYMLGFFRFMQYLHTNVDKKVNHDLKYCLSIQFQVSCNTFILFLLSFFCPVVASSFGKTTREIGATRQVWFGRLIGMGGMEKKFNPRKEKKWNQGKKNQPMLTSLVSTSRLLHQWVLVHSNPDYGKHLFEEKHIYKLLGPN